MPAPRWAVGMRKIGPGVYINAKGEVHVSASEICDHFRVHYNNLNEDTIADVVQQFAAELGARFEDVDCHGSAAGLQERT